MLLAGDIGGTNCRLALFERRPSRLSLTATADYSSAEHSSLGDVVRIFLRQHSFAGTVDAAAFGIAGPVEDGYRVQTTNIPWVVDRASLSAILHTTKVVLINDLVANAYGTCWLTESDYIVLNSGASHPRSNKALISAGTGLGEAGLVFANGHYTAIASEGGHCSFAPQQAVEFELMLFLQERYGHVSWERVVSGAGLANIYEFLCERESQKTAALANIPELANLDLPAMISQAAILGLDRIAEQALEMFIAFYGAEAGNVALKFLATSAVYVAGGIAPKILPKLQEGGFFEAFVSKGRFSRLLEQISIYVILNDRTALLGAALLAARQAGCIFEEPPVIEIG